MGRALGNVGRSRKWVMLSYRPVKLDCSSVSDGLTRSRVNPWVAIGGLVRIGNGKFCFPLVLRGNAERIDGRDVVLELEPDWELIDVNESQSHPY